MRILLTLTLLFTISSLSFAQLRLYRNGQELTAGQTIFMKKGAKLKIQARLTTADIDNDDIDRFPEDTGNWIDSTTSGGNTIIEEFEWTADEATLFDFFDKDQEPMINIPVQIKGIEIGIISADGSGQFSNVVVSDPLSGSPIQGELHKNTLPLAYGLIDSSGNLVSNYGLSSAIKDSIGKYQVELSATPSGYPVPIITPFNLEATGSRLVPTVSVASGSKTVKVNIVGANAAKSAPFHIVVYGSAN